MSEDPRHRDTINKQLVAAVSSGFLPVSFTICWSVSTALLSLSALVVTQTLILSCFFFHFHSSVCSRARHSLTCFLVSFTDDLTEPWNWSCYQRFIMSWELTAELLQVVPTEQEASNRDKPRGRREDPEQLPLTVQTFTALTHTRKLSQIWLEELLNPWNTL